MKYLIIILIVYSAYLIGLRAGENRVKHGVKSLLIDAGVKK